MYFFRGDNRYGIYLPHISKDHVSKGWVRHEEFARVFDSLPVFDFSIEEKSISKTLDGRGIRIFEYKKEVLPTQVFRPTKRPRFHR